MKNVAIINPGPSVSQYYEDSLFEKFDRVYAVNRASKDYRCHFVCMLDHYTYGMWEGGFRSEELTILTSRERTWKRTISQFPELAVYPVEFRNVIKLRLEHEPKPGKRPQPIGWSRKSFLTAVVHAAAQGAEIIHVYGCDMGGTIDYDGYTNSRQNRNDRRWRRELNSMQALIQELPKQTALKKVIRYGYEGFIDNSQLRIPTEAEAIFSEL